MKSRFSHNSINGRNIFLLVFFIGSGTIWAPQIDCHIAHNSYIFSGSLRACHPFWGSRYLFPCRKSSPIYARSELLLFAYMPGSIDLYRSKRPQDAQPPRRGVSAGGAAHLSGGLGAGHQQADFSVLRGSEKRKKWPRVYHGALLATLSFISSPPERREKSRSVETSIPCLSNDYLTFMYSLGETW